MKKTLGLILFLLTFSAQASGNFKLKFDQLKFDRFGVAAALVSPSDINSTTGVSLDVPLGEIYKDVEFAANVDYWASRKGNLDFSDLIFSANARYTKDIALFKLDMDIYAGAGLDLHFYSYEIYTSQIVNSQGSNTKLGLCFIAGDLYRVKEDLDIQLEARYRTNVDQFQVKLGVIFHLF